MFNSPLLGSLGIEGDREMTENEVKERYLMALTSPKAFTREELLELRTALGMLHRFEEGDEILDLILEEREG